MSDAGSVFDPEDPKCGIATTGSYQHRRADSLSVRFSVAAILYNQFVLIRDQGLTRNFHSEPIIDADALCRAVLCNHPWIQMLRCRKILVGTCHIN